MARVAAIVVTHNSALVLDHCLTALGRQTLPLRQLIVVDSGSADPSYLSLVEKFSGSSLLLAENIGFSRSNNLGIQEIRDDIDLLLFVNPDAFLEDECLARAVAVMEDNPELGLLTGRLSGYDIHRDKPTGLLDSTGIFRAWYGRWYDRGQGEVDGDNYDQEEYVPAICGALMFCRRRALETITLPGGGFFDPDFFLYKEDIELSLRMQEAGWRLMYHPRLRAWHCRGWQNRRQMDKKLRLLAAGAELMLYRKHPSPYMGWALFKYLLVRFLGV